MISFLRALLGYFIKWIDANIAKEQAERDRVERARGSSRSSNGPIPDHRPPIPTNHRNNEISGDRSAELQEDGSIEFGVSFDSGADAVLTARRE
jgi:hypothetical protein